MKIISKDLLKPGEEAPKIEFPCDYPIKILGEADEEFSLQVVNIVRQHAPELDESQVAVKESSKGRFLSVTVTIRATGVDQLEAIFADLKAHKAVKMVI